VSDYDPDTHFRARPTEGRIVPHPSTGRPISAEGEVLPRRPYYLRRLDEGALELVEDKPKAKPKPAKKATKKTDPTEEA